MADVAQLLADSLAAHTCYRSALQAKRPGEARAALIDAQTARLAALNADPQRADPAWLDAERTHPHDALLTFYEEQIARD